MEKKLILDKRETYKAGFVNHHNILPGDPYVSPDDCFSNVFLEDLGGIL